MSEPGSESGSVQEGNTHSKRSRFKALLKHGLERGKDELLKGKLKVEHALGLGHQPNVIPAGEIDITGPPRTVEIGWHPVAGLAGKWFAEQTGLGRLITEKINKYPDPTQHWAVLVGDYCHELWMDENLDVIYINEKIVREEWHTFEVGQTRFNDEALREAGEMVIFNMRAKRPGYNLISNNCQNFALAMLDAIQIGAHREFGTSFAVYQRAIGAGKVKDLFLETLPEDDPAQAVPQENKVNLVNHAHQVMDENTTKLDTHHSLH